MYDNLLAGVPTDLWIGGKWKKASDGARFEFSFEFLRVNSPSAEVNGCRK